MEKFKIRPEVEKINEKIIETRRKIHKNPEIKFQEFQTQELILDYLKDFGFQIHKNVGQTGVVAILKGKFPGPCIMLRADMDALPLEEKTGLEFSSKNPHKFHACGHDGQ